MPRLAVLLAISLASSAASAQSSTSPSPQGDISSRTVAESALFSQPNLDPGACPVGFAVERRPATELVSTGKPSRLSGAQRLRVSFQTSAKRHIAGADLLVHGSTPAGEFLPAAAPAGLSEITRSFHLQAGDRSSLTERDILVNHVGSVRSVDLIALRYTDGTGWQAASNRSCRAVPSLYLEIASR